nr:immunoglobulin heavy chain junction region [Mus musculus]NSM09036.1 immunoglobulin heavy chain junction region [Mus musculus]
CARDNAYSNYVGWYFDVW